MPAIQRGLQKDWIRTVTGQTDSRGRLLAAVGLSVVALAGATPADAQVAAEIERALSTPNTVIERFTPAPKRGSFNAVVRDERQLVPIEKARQIRFTLRSVTVEGAFILTPEQLAATWSDQLGDIVSLADLYDIADAMEAMFLDAGYYAQVVVPEQELSSGNIRIFIYESYIRDLTVRSDVPGMRERLAPYIDRITAMRPIRVKDLERQLLLMSDLAGITINGVVTRPKEANGGGSLDLEITFTRASGKITLDNLGDDSAGPLELSGQLTFNDVFGLFESTNMVGLTIPDQPKELLFFQIGQDIPVGTHGLHVGYTLTALTSEPNDPQPIDIDVGVTQLSLFGRYPLIRTIDRSLFAGVGFEARDNDVDIMGQPILRSRARWISASLDLEQALPRGVAKVGAAFNQGINGLGSDGGNDPLSGRPGVPQDYRFVSGTLDVSQALWERAALRLRGLGQYTADPLPAAAQMSLGGDPFGQAFDGSSLSGDSGVAGIVEINQGVDLKVDWIDSSALFVFADYGQLWNHDVAVDYTEADLGSAGFGVRGRVGDTLQGQLLLAIPWKVDDDIDDPGTRVFFKLAADF